MKLAYTRRMITAALEGELEDASFLTDPIFGLEIPEEVTGVPQQVLVPRKTWPDSAAYDKQANRLAKMFVENFVQFEDGVSDEVKATAPTQAVLVG